MKTNGYKIFLVGLVIALLGFGGLVLADTAFAAEPASPAGGLPIAPDKEQTEGTSNSSTGGEVSGTDQGGVGFNTDPSTVNISDVRRLIVRIINWMLGFAALAATVFLIIGAYFWLASAGNAERVEQGKKIMMWTIVGLLMIILAAVLVNTIVAVFG